MNAAEYRRLINGLAQTENTAPEQKAPSPAGNARPMRPLGSIARQRDSVPPPAIRVTAHFFILSRPIKSRLPSGTPLVRRMS